MLGLSSSNSFNQKEFQRYFITFHFIHRQPEKFFGEFSSEDKYTTLESEKLLRLPLWYGMKSAEQQLVVQAVKDFFAKTA